jgi:hypothetical protein
MGALSSPVNRAGEGIKWGLVAYTVAMFSIVTIATATDFDLLSISYIDNREFPGDGTPYPGPLGYETYIYSALISNTPDIMFFLNSCLADGLLVIPRPTQLPVVSHKPFLQLYRCYVIYTANYWIVAFPCLMYLASFGTYLTL